MKKNIKKLGICSAFLLEGGADAELPEVETVRRGLERLVVGRTILSVEVKVPKMIKTSYDSFLNDLPGQTIQAMRRRGKYLIFDFGQLIMISHLRMEGKYLLFTDQVPANKHFHLFFTLDDGSTLVLSGCPQVWDLWFIG